MFTRSVFASCALCLLALAVPGAHPQSQAQGTEPPNQRNVLLLIADDLGVDGDPCAEPQPVPAPRLAAFCNEAVVFNNVWSSPICSPTRAGILTGRHSFRTGIGEQVTRDNGLVLDEAEYTLPEILGAESGYATANFGKWHLGGGPDRPNEMGWDHFSGLLVGGFRDYSRWNKVVNGESIQSTTYATTDQVNDASAWISEQQQPWLAWVAFNAPHTPFHLPPASLHTQQLSGTSADIEANPAAYWRAAIEALDTEIGRLIDSLDPAVLANTTIVFVGDNGTTRQVRGAEDAKGTLSEGGVHVPMMVWGAGVNGGRQTDALVGTVDLFATILEIAGVDTAGALPRDHPIDSVSFADLLSAPGAHNEYLLTELFGSVTRPNRQGIAIRDDQYKLIAYDNGGNRFVDLGRDGANAVMLSADQRTVAEQDRFDRLSAVLDEWTASSDAKRPSALPNSTGWWRAIVELLNQ